MISLGENLAKSLSAPATVELVGDVGVGKTTLAKGIASGLGIKDDITSPSFTIHKQYAGSDYILSHYDFYRLDDPGILANEISENALDAKTIILIEWASSVRNVLPEDRVRIMINYSSDNSRGVAIEGLKK